MGQSLKKWPEIWHSGWILHYDNAQNHKSMAVQQSLWKNKSHSCHSHCICQTLHLVTIGCSVDWNWRLSGRCVVTGREIKCSATVDLCTMPKESVTSARSIAKPVEQVCVFACVHVCVRVCKCMWFSWKSLFFRYLSFMAEFWELFNSIIRCKMYACKCGILKS
jgi:hypothetical protein